ncbi:hypothetical protein [Candidatus Sodalis sp. SoCistrobi]|uniref:hypothetical protein n=1 Tax=Candidatus Sodalis sp. SoCistrobi TaxID=1922216 RepID=UPI0015758B5E|nr:hypothetical protein [Candidatus Sodalis sp. SoCistrobi]
MTKHEKQQINTLCRRLNGANTSLNDGRISLGVVAVAKARTGLLLLLAGVENRATIH